MCKDYKHRNSQKGEQTVQIVTNEPFSHIEL